MQCVYFVMHDAFFSFGKSSLSVNNTLALNAWFNMDKHLVSNAISM